MKFSYEDLSLKEVSDVRRGNATLDMIKKLSRSRDSRIRREVSLGKKTSVDILNNMISYECELYELYGVFCLDVLIGIAQNENANESTFNKLLEFNKGIKGIKDVVKCLSKNPLVTSSILEKLLKIGNENVKINIIAHNNVNNEILEKLSRDKNSGVKKYLIINLSQKYITNNIIDNLSRDEDCYVRMALLENIELSRKALKRMATDNNERVRKEVFKIAHERDDNEIKDIVRNTEKLKKYIE